MQSPVPRHWLRDAILAIAASALALTAAELLVRALDGYELASLRLKRIKEVSEAPPPGAPPAFIAVGPGVDRRWFASSPKPLFADEPVDHNQIAWIKASPDDPIGASLVWNRKYVIESLCKGSTLGSFGIRREFYVREAMEGTIYPYYHHVPNLRVPDLHRTNSLGWRSAEIAVAKPRQTVRVAFVGASTTVGPYYPSSISYPEHVGHWLDLWTAAAHPGTRIEIVNAGRTGIDSTAIAAVVRQEVMPIEPDLVVYYEGANQFSAGDIARDPSVLGKTRPTVTFKQRSVFEQNSALLGRLLDLRDRIATGNGREPRKPPYEVEWPADIQEFDPPLEHQRLPAQLTKILADLESMRAPLSEVGSDLVISSFVWLAHEGLVLDPIEDRVIYRYLNETFWPYRYADMRRVADFQNGVLKKYAHVHKLPFVDVASVFPMDPRFFGDAIHFRPQGTRVHAWIVFQELTRILDARIRAGLLPRAARLAPGPHPMLRSPDVKLSRIDALKECPRGAKR